MFKDNDADVKNRQNRKINKKKTVSGQFYGSQIFCNIFSMRIASYSLPEQGNLTMVPGSTVLIALK